jgi:hypothetical protein
MEGTVMQKLADALGDAGFVIKRIEEEAYDKFDRPASGEKSRRIRGSGLDAPLCAFRSRRFLSVILCSILRIYDFV